MAWIGKERDRRVGADQDQLLYILKHLERLGEGIRDALDRHPACAALNPRVRLLGQEADAGGFRDPPDRLKCRRAQGDAGQHQHRFAARTDGVGRCADVALRHPVARRWCGDRAQRRGAFVPCCIGRKDQGGDPPRRRARLGDGLGRIARHLIGTPGGPDPVRHRGGQRLDVAGQRRIVLQVVAGMIAHQIDDRRAGAPGVVQVGQPVGQPRPEVQQGCRRLVGHPRIAIRRAGDHAFEQAEHAAHPRLAVERCDEMHFGGAGVGEAGIDAAGQQGVAECVGAVHTAVMPPSPREPPVTSATRPFDSIPRLGSHRMVNAHLVRHLIRAAFFQ